MVCQIASHFILRDRYKSCINLELVKEKEGIEQMETNKKYLNTLNHEYTAVL